MNPAGPLIALPISFYPSEASKRILPWLVAVAFFMESLDTTILNTAVPAISSALEEKLCVHASTATNGYLRDEKIDWMIGNLDRVNVSFDGVPSVQDRYRPTAAGLSIGVEVFPAR